MSPTINCRNYMLKAHGAIPNRFGAFQSAHDISINPELMCWRATLEDQPKKEEFPHLQKQQHRSCAPLATWHRTGRSAEPWGRSNPGATCASQRSTAKTRKRTGLQTRSNQILTKTEGAARGQPFLPLADKTGMGLGCRADPGRTSTKNRCRLQKPRGTWLVLILGS